MSQDFNLTLYDYRDVKIETEQVTDLEPAASRTVSFIWTTTGLQAGSYSVRAVAQGQYLETNTTNNEFVRQMSIGASQPSAQGIPWEILIPIVAAAAVAGVVLVYVRKRLKRKKGKLKPPEVRVTANPKEITADGKSTSRITVELIDKNCNQLPCIEDIVVNLSSTVGRVARSVTVPKDGFSATTVLTSSATIGKVTITASTKELKTAATEMTFTEKKRYCMHCGAAMQSAAKACPEYGRSPPAGMDTKVCDNCKSVIPVVAKFYSECGASQPKEG